MKTKMIKQALATAIIVAFCTTAVAGTGSMSVEIGGSKPVVSSGPAKIKDVSVTDGATMTISGKVRKLVNSKVRGHVDFAAFDGSGKLLQKGSVGYSPSLTGGKSRKEASFNASVDGTNGKAQKLVVSYHGKGSMGTSVYDCGENKAASGS